MGLVTGETGESCLMRSRQKVSKARSVKGCWRAHTGGIIASLQPVLQPHFMCVASLFMLRVEEFRRSQLTD